jgi:hypothetical protein
MRAYLAPLVVLAGCGGAGVDEPLGVYQVTLHTENDAGCTEGAPVAEPPYFSFEYFGELNGRHLYEVRGCTSADESTCPDTLAFVADAPVGLFAFFQDAAQAGSECTLDFTTYSGLLDGERFELHTSTYEEIQTSPPSCTPADAGARGDDMPCVALEHLVGTRVVR